MSAAFAKTATSWLLMGHKRRCRPVHLRRVRKHAIVSSPRIVVMQSVKKVVGVDCELLNTLQIPGSSDGFPDRASAMLIEQTPGYPRRDPRSGSPAEMGRAFLTNG